MYCSYLLQYTVVFAFLQTVVSIFCRHYQQMEDCEKEKSALLAVLSGDLGVDHASILSSAHRLTELHSEVREGRGEGR